MDDAAETEPSTVAGLLEQGRDAGIIGGGTAASGAGGGAGDKGSRAQGGGRSEREGHISSHALSDGILCDVVYGDEGDDDAMEEDEPLTVEDVQEVRGGEGWEIRCMGSRPGGRMVDAVKWWQKDRSLGPGMG